MRNTILGLGLMVLGIGLVMLATMCPCLSLLGALVVLVLGVIVVFTALALMAGWSLIEKIIDKALEFFAKLRQWTLPKLRRKNQIKRDARQH